MASVKVRSRAGGSAVPLDDLDRRLLNLMQGRFPLAARPYAAVAREAEITEDEALTRVARLVDERIIREVTPIYDTRALGYSSMLVAAKMDRREPPPGGGDRQLPPGRLAQLPARPRLQPVVHAGRRAGLGARPPGHDRRAPAPHGRRVDPPAADPDAVQDPHGPRDGEGHRRPCDRGGGGRAAETEPQPYDDLDIAVIRATQGHQPVVAEPYAEPAADLGMGVDDLLAHMKGMINRRLLRRVAAILFHRRAGFSANGMGVWKVPEADILETATRMASVRGISHCYQRPTYPDWPYSVFTMAHGRSKEECDAILDSIAEMTGIEDRATLYSSTEFKKVRLLYFTDDFKRWEAEHG